MFTEKFNLPDGIIVGNQLFTECIMEEETLKHALKATSLPGIDFSRMDDEAYYHSAVLAARLNVPGLFDARMNYDPDFRAMVENYADEADIAVKKVTGIKFHPVSAEMIESLSRSDGRVLLATSAILDKRRSEFREKALAEAHGHPGAAQAGVPGDGDPGKNSGGAEEHF